MLKAISQNKILQVHQLNLADRFHAFPFTRIEEDFVDHKSVFFRIIDMKVLIIIKTFRLTSRVSTEQTKFGAELKCHLIRHSLIEESLLEMIQEIETHALLY